MAAAGAGDVVPPIFGPITGRRRIVEGDATGAVAVQCQKKPNSKGMVVARVFLIVFICYGGVVLNYSTIRAILTTDQHAGTILASVVQSKQQQEVDEVQVSFYADTTNNKNININNNVSFLPHETLSRIDSYGAAWWQSTSRFLGMNTDHIHMLEDATFRAIREGGNDTADIRMTRNWIDFVVEHLSQYHRLLDHNGSIAVQRRLSNFVDRSSVVSSAMQTTIAVVPYQGCHRDFREDFRILSGDFCIVALSATIASLVRHGVGRVVIVTHEEDDRNAVETMLDSTNLRRRFDSTTQFICIATDIIYAGKIAHLPKTALSGLSNAFKMHNQTWLGHPPRNRDDDDNKNSSRFEDFEYVYFTEPDQILVGSLNHDNMKIAMDSGGIIIPHRLEAVPHWSDFVGVDTQTVVIPTTILSTIHTISLLSSSSSIGSHNNNCCQAGHVPVKRCPGSVSWQHCPFPPLSHGSMDVFNNHEFVRLVDGSGVTLLATKSVDYSPAYCRPSSPTDQPC